MITAAWTVNCTQCNYGRNVSAYDKHACMRKLQSFMFFGLKICNSAMQSIQQQLFTVCARNVCLFLSCMPLVDSATVWWQSQRQADAATVTCLYIKRGKMSVTYIHNDGHGQLRNEWRHNENDVIMRTGAASAVCETHEWRHNENDIIMTIAGLWRRGDWWHVAMDCITLVILWKSVTWFVVSLC